MSANLRRGRVQVIGAGLAGLAAALRLSAEGIQVTVYEATRRAGGRLRSWQDRRLGVGLDNGLHWFLSGQRAVIDYLEEIDALGTLEGPADGGLDFLDVENGARWHLAPNAGRLPWWILSQARNAAGTGLRDLVGLGRLLLAGDGRTVSDVLGSQSASLRRFWEPLTVAALNTPIDQASARDLRRVVINSLPRGADGLRIRFPATTLHATFIGPALRTLSERGVRFHYAAGLQMLDSRGDRACGLCLRSGVVSVDPNDAAIIAVPPHIAARHWRGVPERDHAIVTVHYRSGPPAEPKVACLIDSRPLWTQSRNGVTSVTVGAADDLAVLPVAKIGEALWPSVAEAYGHHPSRCPPFRVVKERRGAFAHTPANVRRRGTGLTPWRNVFAAGDWVDTGVSASMESAILSGRSAARAALAYIQGA